MASINALSVEVLEYILVHLDMNDLLRIQRVSRHWRAVITLSPHLRRMLFLGFVSRAGSGGDPARFVKNNTPLLAIMEPIIPGLDRGFKVPPPSYHRDQQKYARPTVLVNPIFPSQGDIIRMRTWQFREGPASTSSWTDMFLTHPPVRYVHVTVYFAQKAKRQLGFTLPRRSRRTGAADVLVQRCGGVRARDILEELKKLNVADSREWQRLDISIPGIVPARPEEICTSVWPR